MESKAELNRVGILLIHGIGEQSQFEHLEEVVRNVATALDADQKIESFTVCVNSSKDSAYRARQQIWKGGEIATAFIDIQGPPGTPLTRLEFREVWWADLDEPSSLKTALSFWGWALSLWSQTFESKRIDNVPQPILDPQPSVDPLPSMESHPSMEPLPLSEPPGMTRRIRLYLFLVSLVVLLLFPLLWLAGKLLNRVIGFNVKPDILVDFLGDVKLYQQRVRTGMGPLVELGKKKRGETDSGKPDLKAPPRFSIRRRVISAMVEMAMEDYQRWYIFSHSLGSVCAFNGLMEADIALPRYLDEKLWQRWCAWCRKKKDLNNGETMEVSRNLSDAEKQAQAKALPLRPSWLSPDNTDFIDRRALFHSLDGFLTYGSPISKFARLWPDTVPLNRDLSMFRDRSSGGRFEWVNVLDPTDPVANYILPPENQGSDALAGLNLKEVPYKAGQLHLLSHTQYLAFDANRDNPLVAVVARWLVDGGDFPKPDKDDISQRLGWPKPATKQKRFPVDSVYYYLGIFCWVALACVFSFFLSMLLPYFLQGIPSLLAMVPIDIPAWLNSLLCLPSPADTSEALCLLDWSQPVSYLAVSIGVIALFGTVAWLLRPRPQSPSAP